MRIRWSSCSSARAASRRFSSSLGETPVLQLGRLLEVAHALGLLGGHPGVLDLLLELADPLDRLLLGGPVATQLVGLLAQLGELLVDPLEPLRGLGVVLLGERLLLDLELGDPALDHVDLDRHRVDLHPEPAGGLVDEVDRLVGQEPVADVAVGQPGRGHDGGVGDPHPVMDLVPLLEAAQDGDRVVDGGLADVDRLEPSLQRGVLLDVLLELVERGGADHPQLAAGQRRLDHVRGVDRALGPAGPDQGVELVDEGDHLALALGDLLQDRLEPLLELAAVLGAGHHGADVELDQPLLPEALRHVAGHDPLGQALHDGGLSHAGLADQDRVVLGAPRQDLHDPADLLVPADHRIELAALRRRDQVATVPLEGLVLLLRVGIGDPLRAADLPQDPQDVVAADPGGVEDLPHRAGLRLDPRQQRVLDGGVLVAERVALPLGSIEQPGELAPHPRLGPAAGLRQPVDGVADPLARRGGGHAEPVEQRGEQPALGLEERRGEVLGDDLRIAVLLRRPLGGDEGLLEALGESFEIHGSSDPVIPYVQFYTSDGAASVSSLAPCPKFGRNDAFATASASRSARRAPSGGLPRRRMADRRIGRRAGPERFARPARDR